MHVALITQADRATLVANHLRNASARDRDGRTEDLRPVVKLFTPGGAGTWLLTELDPETGTAYGLCDLGLGYPELGYVLLSELPTKPGRGAWVERDRHWTAKAPLSVYIEAALDACRIVELPLS